MGFELRRFPEHDLTLRIVSGPTTVEDVIRFYEELDASHGTRWLTYIDPGVVAEMGDIVPVARIPEIREVIAAKLEKLFGDKPVTGAVVSASTVLDDALHFWRTYSDAGEAHPIHPALFSTLDEAYNWLGLPDPARAEVTRAVEDRIGAEKGLKAEHGPGQENAPAHAGRG